MTRLTDQEERARISASRRLSVAPMMDWTDRHCRYLHRQITRRTLLYTEMITAPALVRGGALHLLDFDAAEHPVAVQLGGSDPAELAEAAVMAAERGYDEVNLNVGCPSDRVQAGTFGAVLMKDPALVARIVRAMIDACPVEVTVKCRIGVDDQDPEIILPDFVARMRDVGVKSIAIHARKAWLEGLSPKENRDVPPLDYPLVHRIKRQFPDMQVAINGGIEGLEAAQEHLAAGLDGVMIGRAAYHRPWDVLGDADRAIFGNENPAAGPAEVVDAMRPYIAAHLDAGGKLAQVTRHMLGLFHGMPGARRWRQVLSENAHRDGVGVELLDQAMGAMAEAA